MKVFLDFLSQQPILLVILTALIVVILLFICVILYIKVVKRDQPLTIKWLGIHVGVASKSTSQMPNPYSKENLLKVIEKADNDLKNALFQKIIRSTYKIESSAGLIYFNPNANDPTSLLRRDIHDRIKAALTKAKTIKIMLATAGPVFTEAESVLEEVVREKLQRIVATEKGSRLERERAGHFQLLLLDPDCSEIIAERADATRTDVEVYRMQILRSIQYMKSYIRESRNIELRLYRQIPQWKLFLCDNEAFVQFYSSGKTGLQSPLYVFDIENSKSLGPVFYEIFDTIWCSAQAVTNG